MKNKYVITYFCHKRNGVTLHRIRAIRDFSNVKAGDLGGWVESEGNLSQLGDCWVYGQAKVCGQAEVSGQAEVCGQAVISDDAEVCGQAKVCGQAMITQSEEYMAIFPIGSRNDCTTFFRTADGGISVNCGCFFGTIEQFELAVEKTHSNNKHGQTYKKAIELARIQLGRKQ